MRSQNGRPAWIRKRPLEFGSRPLSLLVLTPFFLHRLLASLVGGAQDSLLLIKDLFALIEHILDPIPFEKGIAITFERAGYALRDGAWRITNDRADAFSSVAYWYQEEPHGEPQLELPVHNPRATTILDRAQIRLPLLFLLF